MRQLRKLPSNVACLTIALLVAVSCTTSTDPVPIETISLQPALDSIEVGATYDNWVVVVKDAQGNTLTGRALTWSSSNTTVATVDPGTGVVTAVASGEAGITARGGGKEGLGVIRVLVPVLGVVATPDSFDLPMTTTRAIGLQLFGPNGVALTNRQVIWSTQNPTVAVVSTSGIVTPITLGTTTVTARVSTKQANVRVRVIGEPVTSVRILPLQPVHILRLGQAKQLTAECLSATGIVLAGRPVIWVSSNPLAATVNSNGLVSSAAVGTSIITATCDNTANSSISVQVTPIPVSSVSITPPSATLQQGAQQQMTAVARDSTGTVLSLQNRTVTWNSSNNPVATVNTFGVVVAFSLGTADITASVDGVLSTPATITVANPFAMRTTPPWSNAVPVRAGGALPDR